MLRAAIETQTLQRLEERLEELAPSMEGRGDVDQAAGRGNATCRPR
jgi:hypothetical protein